VVAKIPDDSVAFRLNQTTWLSVPALLQDWPSNVRLIVAGAFVESKVVVPGKFASIAVCLAKPSSAGAATATAAPRATTASPPAPRVERDTSYRRPAFRGGTGNLLEP
jgi:hypothetical protein